MMQGPPRRDNRQWESAATQLQEALTNEHRAIPRRPATMPYVEGPPPTSKQKVVRPTAKLARPRSSRELMIFWGSIVLGGALISTLAFVLAYNLFLSRSPQPLDTASSFLDAVSGHDYNQAYRMLNVNMVLHTSPEDFQQQAQAADRCFGPMTQFKQVGDAQQADQEVSYTYMVRRSKVSRSYTLHLTVEQSANNDAGTWSVASYGNGLGPAPATCK